MVLPLLKKRRIVVRVGQSMVGVVVVAIAVVICMVGKVMQMMVVKVVVIVAQCAW